MSLSRVQNFFFNPFFSQEESIAFLLSQKKNSVMAVRNQLIYCIDGKIQQADNKFTLTELLDSFDAQDAERAFESHLMRFAELDSLRSLPVNLKFSGCCETVSVNNKFPIFTVSETVEKCYFDTVIYWFDESGNLYTQHYNNTTEIESPITHSGDIGNLLHYLSIRTNMDGFRFVVCVIGFRQTPLIKFCDSRPTIAISDTKSISLIPISLTKEVMGNASFSTMMVCELGTASDGKQTIKYFVPENNEVVRNVDVGDCSEKVRDVISRVIQNGFPCKQPVEKQSIDFTSTSFPPRDIHLYQANLDSNTIGFTDSEKIPFGNGIGSGESEICFSPFSEMFSGHPAVLFGKPNMGLDLKQFKNLIIANNPVLHLCTKGWNLFVNKAGCTLADMLIIIHFTKEESENPEKADITCLSGVAGPRSIIISEYHGKYYFYRGYQRFSEWKSFKDEISLEEITDLIATNKPYPSLSLKTDNRLYDLNSNSWMSIDKFIQLIDSLNISQLSETEIKYLSLLLIQFQTIGCEQDIQQIKSVIQKRLIELRQQILAPIQSTLESIIAVDIDVQRLKSLADEKKLIEKSFDAKYQILLHTLHNMCSYHAAISHEHIMKRLMRQQIIDSNIAKANSMSASEFIRELESNIKEHGFLCATLNTYKLYQIISNMVKVDEFDKDYMQLYEGICVPSSKCMTLDSDSIESLYEIASNYKFPLKLSDHEFNTLLPLLVQSSEDSEDCTLPIPIFDKSFKFDNMIDWREECNLSHIATQRIKLRGLLAAIKTSNGQLPANHVDLGKVIIRIYISLAKQLGCNARIPSDGSTMQNIFRGLIYLIFTTAASGVGKPQHTVFELFSEKKITTPDSKQVLQDYVDVIGMLKFAGLSDQVPRKNLEKALSQFCFKRINSTFESNENYIQLNSEADNLKLSILNILMMELASYNPEVFGGLLRDLIGEKPINDIDLKLYDFPQKILFDNKNEMYMDLFQNKLLKIIKIHFPEAEFKSIRIGSVYGDIMADEEFTHSHIDENRILDVVNLKSNQVKYSIMINQILIEIDITFNKSDNQQPQHRQAVWEDSLYVSAIPYALMSVEEFKTFLTQNLKTYIEFPLEEILQNIRDHKFTILSIDKMKHWMKFERLLSRGWKYNKGTNHQECLEKLTNLESDDSCGKVNIQQLTKKLRKIIQPIEQIQPICIEAPESKEESDSKQLVAKIPDSEQLVAKIPDSEQLVAKIPDSEQLVAEVANKQSNSIWNSGERLKNLFKSLLSPFGKSN